MSIITSQFTDNLTVCLKAYSGWHKEYERSKLLDICDRWIPPHTGPVMHKVVPCYNVIMKDFLSMYSSTFHNFSHGETVTILCHMYILDIEYGFVFFNISKIKHHSSSIGECIMMFFFSTREIIKVQKKYLKSSMDTLKNDRCELQGDKKKSLMVRENMSELETSVMLSGSVGKIVYKVEYVGKFMNM